MIRLLLTLATLGVAAEAVAAQSLQIANSQQTEQASVAHLRGLDILSGTTTDLTVAVGQTITFGRLEITLDTCRVPQDDPKADAYAFLRIRDSREDAPRFSGWMLASSPALSALDHPRYDVWVVSCSNR